MTHGWLNLYKETGISSFEALKLIKKIFAGQKVGHAGTLDPFASGVLPVAIGEGTKTVSYFMDQTKEYHFTALWGISTDSYDITGKVAQTSEFIPTKDNILNVLPQFTGKILQSPPPFSAIKINGQRAYNMARNGKEFSIPKRSVLVLELELLEHKENRSIFRAKCGKGVYVRSLAHDMAIALGSFGCVETLTRTRYGAFDIENSINLEKIQNHLQSDAIKGKLPLYSISYVLDDILVHKITEEQKIAIKQGKSLQTSQAGSAIKVLAVCNGIEVAICNLNENGILSPIRVFNF